ncbi:hypothetical protein JCM33374_g2939 [Metschnikowia sp. JCM 33374]|nr:hypothetical protein JCM33374_g2939 [Metschnikowia sp. JCM 33374]
MNSSFLKKLASRSVVTFALSTIALVLLLLANLSGADAPFFRHLYLSRIESDETQFYWTLYTVCSSNASEPDVGFTCSAPKPAYPYEPYEWVEEFDMVEDYKKASQAGYVLVLLAFIFTAIAQTAHVVSYCKKSCAWFGVFQIMTTISVFVILVGALIETAIHKNGSSKIMAGGVYTTVEMGQAMLAFQWFPTFFQLVCVVVSCLMRNDYRSRSGGPEKQAGSRKLHIQAPSPDYYHSYKSSSKPSSNVSYTGASDTSTTPSSKTGRATESTAPTENDNIVIDLTEEKYDICMISRNESTTSYKSTIEKTKDGKNVEVVLVEEDEECDDRDDLSSIYSWYMTNWEDRNRSRHQHDPIVAPNMGLVHKPSTYSETSEASDGSGKSKEAVNSGAVFGYNDSGYNDHLLGQF